jgi:hypothetical protein
MAAIAIVELHNVLAVTLAALTKQVSGNSAGARADVLTGLDMVEKAGASANALIEAAAKLIKE